MLRNVSFLILLFLLTGCNSKYIQESSSQAVSLKIVNKSYTDITLVTYADGEICKGPEDIEVPMEVRNSQIFNALKPNDKFELKISPVKRFSLSVSADGSIYPTISVCTITTSFYPREKSYYRYTFSWDKYASVCSVDVTEITYDSNDMPSEKKLDDVVVREHLPSAWNDGAGCK